MDQIDRTADISGVTRTSRDVVEPKGEAGESAGRPAPTDEPDVHEILMAVADRLDALLVEEGDAPPDTFVGVRAADARPEGRARVRSHVGFASPAPVYGSAIPTEVISLSAGRIRPPAVRNELAESGEEALGGALARNDVEQGTVVSPADFAAVPDDRPSIDDRLQRVRGRMVQRRILDAAPRRAPLLALPSRADLVSAWKTFMTACTLVAVSVAISIFLV